MAWDVIWEKVFRKNEWGKYPAEPLIRFVAKNFYPKERKTCKILEVGCGTGANIWFIAREGFSAFGIDASKTAIEKCQKRLYSENLVANLNVGDIDSLPYEDDFFDGVIDNECLYCNNESDTHKILSEIRRTLKPDGLFFSRTFTNNNYIGKQYREMDQHQYTDVLDGIFAHRGFVRLIDRNGIDELYGKHFKIVSIDQSVYTINNGQLSIEEWLIIGKKT
jgi:SAM-dependent methyltransferase